MKPKPIVKITARRRKDYITGEYYEVYDIEGIPHHFPELPHLSAKSALTISQAQGDVVQVLKPSYPPFEIDAYKREPHVALLERTDGTPVYIRYGVWRRDP